MTSSKKCSALRCENKAFKYIEIKAYSRFTKSNYVMSIYVCPECYSIEHKAGSILHEESIMTENLECHLCHTEVDDVYYHYYHSCPCNPKFRKYQQ